MRREAATPLASNWSDPAVSVIQLRTFPGLWVGRRTVLRAVAVESGEVQAMFRCGACMSMLATCEAIEDLREVVVKCQCGEYNQV
jgi:hypothetical protein